MKSKKLIESYPVRIKSRNPILVALKKSCGNSGAGIHEKSKGALRRAEKIQLAREILQLKNRVK